MSFAARTLRSAGNSTVSSRASCGRYMRMNASHSDHRLAAVLLLEAVVG
jgi:hypothetical protein